MKKKLLFILLVIFSCKQQDDSVRPIRSDLVESVYSSVTIQPDSLYKAFSTVVAILDENLVEEGDLVLKGTPLVKLIDLKPLLNKENAKLNFQLLQDKSMGGNSILNSIQKEIRAAEITFFNDSINYTRQMNLWDQEIGSRIELENRKLTYELSRNKLDLLQKEYNRTKDELSNQIQLALNNYKSSEYSASEFSINSKLNGRVYALYKNPGELVNTIEPVALVGSAKKFLIELLVDETDIIKLEHGQEILLTLDAYERQVFHAKISKIYPTKDERTQTFKVEAEFIQAPSKLYPGLVGEANIIISKKQNALSIPKEYLFNLNQVLTSDGTVTIKTGIQDIERVEIISGIDESDEIFKPIQ